MIKFNTAAIAFCLLGVLPMAVSAQSSQFGAREGECEFSISGTGNSDRNLDSGSPRHFDRQRDSPSALDYSLGS